MRTSFALLLLTLAAAPIQADEGEMRGAERAGVEVPAGFLDLSAATVLASPETPSALWSHLPGGARPGPLSWPLPAGPLLVLGLPSQDPVARDIALAFGLLEDPEDLAGGYGVWAWRDGERPLAVILGADPAALFAARFELEPEAAMEMVSPQMRTVELARPDAEAAVLMRVGTRQHVPPARIRALYPTTDDFDVADVIEAAGRHVNRLWIDPMRFGRRALRLARACRRYGILPVVVRQVPAAASDLDVDLLHAGARLGTQHYALVAPGPQHDASALWGLLDGRGASFTVVPWPGDDPAPPAAPGRVLGWTAATRYGGRPDPDAAARTAAAAAPQEAVFFDTWAAPFQDQPDVIPTAPEPRADVLRQLAGHVVVGHHHTGPLLAEGWGETVEVAPDPFATYVGGPKAADHVRAVREQLASTARGAAWAPALAETLATIDAERMREVLPVPVVRAEITPDGVLDEAAWAYARSLDLPDGAGQLLLLSNGRDLCVGLRTDAPSLDVIVGSPEHFGASLTRRPGLGFLASRRLNRLLEPVATKDDGARATAECRFDRFDLLRGDAVPGQVLYLRVMVGEGSLFPGHPERAPARQVWPPDGQRPGVLLVVP